MTYVFFRQALDTLDRAPTRVHRGLVHAGPCWPSDCDTWFTPDRPMPPLPAPLAGYLPDERLPVDAKRKLELISNYTSQAGTQPKLDWLSSFARPEEIFFTERYEHVGGRWVQRGATREGDTTTLRTGDFVETQRWSDGRFAVTSVAPTSSSR